MPTRAQKIFTIIILLFISFIIYISKDVSQSIFDTTFRNSNTSDSFPLITDITDKAKELTEVTKNTLDFFNENYFNAFYTEYDKDYFITRANEYINELIEFNNITEQIICYPELNDFKRNIIKRNNEIIFLLEISIENLNNDNDEYDNINECINSINDLNSNIIPLLCNALDTLNITTDLIITYELNEVNNYLEYKIVKVN